MKNKNYKSKKKYTVREKEAHYNEIIANEEKVKKDTDKATLADRRVSYANGYNQAVRDCRAALKVNTKSATKGE